MQNKIRLFLFVLVSLVGFTGCQSVPQFSDSASAVNAPEGATVLFNGQDLSGWKVTPWTYAGPVEVENGQLILNEGHECTGVTWEGDFPISNYEVELDAKRVEGMDFFCGLTFPVGDEPCSLIIGGWGGSTLGLSSIDGLDAAHNETQKLMDFVNDRWYHIKLRVTDEKIEAWIDGDQIVDFTIGNHTLSIRMEVLWSQPFGVCSWRTTAAIKDFWLRKI